MEIWHCINPTLKTLQQRWMQKIKKTGVIMQSAAFKSEIFHREETNQKQNKTFPLMRSQGGLPACTQRILPCISTECLIPTLESFLLCLFSWEKTDASGETRHASSDGCNFTHVVFVTLSSITLQAWSRIGRFTTLFYFMVLIGSIVFSNWHLHWLKAVTDCCGRLPTNTQMLLSH